MRRLLCSLLVTYLVFAGVGGNASYASQPITTDSRIKTFVYNPNEVFTVTTHYGYQSNIEFGEKETIETISMGDRVAWQISPAQRRLFIRAQEENAHTNMTVVTNLRAYQFDLRSSSADAVFGSEELTYVVRFFYPDEAGSAMPVASMSAPIAPIPNPMPVLERGVPMAPPAAAMPMVHTPGTAYGGGTAPVAMASAAPIPSVSPAPPVVPAFNYRYTFSGSNAIAPLKIFDDGKSTYFKFSGQLMPSIAVVTAKGETLPITTRRTEDGLVAVSAIAPRFSITQAGEQVIVYNEAGGML